VAISPQVIQGAENLFFKTRTHAQAIVVRDVLVQETIMSKKFKAILEKDADANYDEYASIVGTIK
jgi:hypothetical protein